MKASDSQYDLTKAKIVAKAQAKGKYVAVGKQGYTGKAVEPGIQVLAPVKEGKKTNWKEVPETEYTVSYINNIGKGKATILVTGSGEGTVGSKAANFTITAMSLGK